MRVALLDHRPGLSAYIGEILNAWGLCAWSTEKPETLGTLDPQERPVLILPAGAVPDPGPIGTAVLAYVQRGGTAVVMLPTGELARAAGIEAKANKEPPLRLRLAGRPMAGLAGESLPVVGMASTWRLTKRVLAEAFLYPAGLYGGESPGIVRAPVGDGTIIALAFDLPRAVLMLRQGDPSNREEGGRSDGPPRPTHLAWNRTEFDAVAGAGGSMNLYVIPGNTRSTPENIAVYRRHHDVGPHPNIRSLDCEPVAARTAEMERQIQQFEQMFEGKAHSLRNHCLAWAGYLEPVEAMARCGVGMEGNYFCSTFLRGGDYAPYAVFGAALPLRFCHPGGDLIKVCQQHTHTMDDVYFGPEWMEYSYRLSPDQWETILARVFDEVVSRFHVPHAVCIHPSNWVRFSRDQGMSLLHQAARRGIPIWSFDQWLHFWEARRTWQCETMTWDGGLLRVSLQGDRRAAELHLALPEAWGDRRLGGITVEGESVLGTRGQRHGRQMRLVSVGGGSSVAVTANYAATEDHD